MQGLPVKSWPSCPARFVNKSFKENKLLKCLNLSCIKKEQPSEDGRHIQRRGWATFAFCAVGICAHLGGWHQPMRAAWAWKLLLVKVAFLCKKKIKNTKKYFNCVSEVLLGILPC
jgi:hypothetical protein